MNASYNTGFLLWWWNKQVKKSSKKNTLQYKKRLKPGDSKSKERYLADKKRNQESCGCKKNC